MRKQSQNSMAHNPKPKKNLRGWIIAISCITMLALIAVLGYLTIHVWTEATCTQPATCRICGNTSGKRAEHNWLDATCTKPQTCAACGKEKGDPLEHAWQEATCQKPQTCAECGLETGVPIEHNWKSATCLKLKTCADCGLETGEFAEHDWRRATCQTPKTCGVCGTQTGGLGDHVWKDATYNDPKICTLCSEKTGTKKSPSSPIGLQDIASSATASSVYRGDDLGSHDADKMYDGRLSTNWTENVPGSGIGEYATIYFDGTYAVKELYISIGTHHSRKAFKQSNRPRTITLTFSDGSTERIPLTDTLEEQKFTFDQYYYTTYVKITIDDVYYGTMFDHTIIAELDVTAYKP